MPEPFGFPIGYVSAQTGLSSHVIRAWERRHKAILPGRSKGRRRLYTESDIDRLLLLKQAIQQGHRISTVAALETSELIDLIHAMRARIIKAQAFTGEMVMGAILFEQTMDREIEGKPAAKYLWEDKHVVPFLKVDKGIEDAVDGVRLMKPIPTLDTMCERAVGHGVFGTKMRSVIDAANETGIRRIVSQQFQFGEQIMGHGLMPILEPEVTISIDDKADA